MDNANYVDRKQIVEKGKLLGVIGFKPFSSIYIVAGAGVLIAVLTRNLFGIIMGGFMLAIAGIIYFGVKDHPVMEVYDDAILVINSHDLNTAWRIPVDRIQKYIVNKDDNHTIMLQLTDGSQTESMSYQTRIAVSLLKQALPGKSNEERIQQENDKRKAAGFSFGRFFDKK